jgi:microcystin-dependent protein
MAANTTIQNRGRTNFRTHLSQQLLDTPQDLRVHNWVFNQVTTDELFVENCTIHIGTNAGGRPYLTQATGSLSLGCHAGEFQQGVSGKFGAQSAIGIGADSGRYYQSANSISVGFQAGLSNQGINENATSEDQVGAIAIGPHAGQTSQSFNSICIGERAGETNQGEYTGGNALAIGTYAGQLNQEQFTLALGTRAGQTSQQEQAIALGLNAGNSSQRSQSIAIGAYAGEISQGANSGNSIAIGTRAGQTSQNTNAVSIGAQAGQTSQQYECVAIGVSAGNSSQQPYSISIGSFAGAIAQGITEEATGGHCVAIGRQAGYSNQGDFSVAIGAFAGVNNQADSSIILNASESVFDAPTEGLYVRPIRQRDTDQSMYTVHYQPSSGEVIYGLGNSNTPGIINLFAGPNAPLGYLFCDGSAISRSTYSNLFAVLGTIYGNGDGINTFNLPNLQGRVPVGLDTQVPATGYANTLGESGGEPTHTLTVNEMPSHSHSYFNQSNSHQVAVSLTTTGTADDVNVDQTTGSTGGSQAHNNLQPYIVLNYIISY